ncbi:hypothetical protein DV737_g5657, partial [Chaetothyriales sp. CBS 132003]
MGKKSGLRSAAEAKTALLLVDIQQGLTTDTGFFGTERSTPQFEDNVARLLLAARKYNAHKAAAAAATDDQGKSIFIIHVYHNSTNPESPLWPDKATNAIQPCAAPVAGEPVLCKRVNCSFIGTDLEKRLLGQEIRQLLIFGISTAHCVSTTVRLAADLEIVGPRDGGGVAIVSDASATFNDGDRFDAETVQAVSLGSLEGEFAEVVTTDEVLKQVLAEG